MSPLNTSNKTPERSTDYSTIEAYFAYIAKIRVLSPDEEVSLAKRYHQGDATARREFFKANLKLVVSIAKRYTRMARHFSLMDLIQEGNLALPQAMDRFDPERGYKFSTYASWFIRQAIIRAIQDRERQIRVPVYLQEKFFHINKVRRTLAETMSHVNDEAIVNSFPPEERARIRNVLECLRTTATRSLNQPFGDSDDSFSPEDVLSDGSDPIERMESERQVQRLLGLLPPREAYVIQGRFLEEKTLEALGEELSVTKERIRQLEKHALERMRKHL